MYNLILDRPIYIPIPYHYNDTKWPIVTNIFRSKRCSEIPLQGWEILTKIQPDKSKSGVPIYLPMTWTTHLPCLFQLHITSLNYFQLEKTKGNHHKILLPRNRKEKQIISMIIILGVFYLFIIFYRVPTELFN